MSQYNPFVMRSAMKKIFALISLFFLASLSDALYANIADTYGCGGRGVGMGNAMVSLVDDWSSPYYNIAGLGRKPKKADLSDAKSKVSLVYKTLTGAKKKTVSEKDESKDKRVINNNELAIGYLYTMPLLNVSYPGATELKNMNSGALFLGLTMDLNTFIRMPYDLGLRFGVTAILEDDFGLGKVTDDDTQVHYFLRYGRRIQRFLLNMGLGFEVWKEHLYLGIGSTIGVGGQGVVKIEEVNLTEEQQSPPTRSKLNLKPRQAPVAGISFKWEDLGPGTLNAGFAYRGELMLKIDPFDTQATTTLGNVNMKMYIAIQDYYTPHEFVGGVAYTYNDFWIFKACTWALDIEYQMWSKYDLSATQKSLATYEKPNFKDIIIYKFGMEETVRSWLKVRQGYIYEPAFTPDQTGRSNYLDNNKHILSLGLGFIIPDVLIQKVPLEVDVAYQYQYLLPRKSEKTNPTVYNPSYSYDGQVHTFMGSLRIRY